MGLIEELVKGDIKAIATALTLTLGTVFLVMWGKNLLVTRYEINEFWIGLVLVTIGTFLSIKYFKKK